AGERPDLKQRLELRRRTRQLSPPAATGAPISVSQTSPESVSRGDGMLHFFPGASSKTRAKPRPKTTSTGFREHAGRVKVGRISTDETSCMPAVQGPPEPDFAVRS